MFDSKTYTLKNLDELDICKNCQSVIANKTDNKFSCVAEDGKPVKVDFNAYCINYEQKPNSKRLNPVNEAPKPAGNEPVD